MGKFDEIFELPHILRIICDLDKYSRNIRYQYFEIIDSNLVIQELYMPELIFFLKETVASRINLH